MTAARSTAQSVPLLGVCIRVICGGWWLFCLFYFLRVRTDHVLISKELNKAVSRVAYRHDFVPAEFCDRTQRLTSSYSDHWPIVIEFDLSILFEEWRSNSPVRLVDALYSKQKTRWWRHVHAPCNGGWFLMDHAYKRFDVRTKERWESRWNPASKIKLCVF